MMIQVTRVNDSITGSVNGTPFAVVFSEARYARMKELEAAMNQAQSMEEARTILEEFEPMTIQDYSEVVAHVGGGEYLYINPATGQYFLKIGEKVSTEPIPNGLVKRITESVDKQIDVLPIVKAWTRFLRNPFYSRQKATRFVNYINTTYVSPELKAKLIEHGASEMVANAQATVYQVPITQEGLLCTYKVSREITTKFEKDPNSEDGVKEVDRFDYDVDEFTGLKTYKKPDFVEDRFFEPAVMGKGGDEFNCGERKGHLIQVGKRHWLDSWDQVNTDDNQSCVPGLHVGNLDYIRCYQSEGTETHNVFVDPMDIGAFTNDGTGAIRCLSYFVHSSFAGVNRSLYHSSKYAAESDERFRQMVEEAVEVETKGTGKAETLKSLL